jgi:hypothetical protein
MPTASHSPIEASAERTRGVAELIVAAQLSPAPVADRQSVEVTLVSEVGRPATSVRGRVTVTAAAASAQIVERGRLRKRWGGQFRWDRLRSPYSATVRQCWRRGHERQSCRNDREEQHGFAYVVSASARHQLKSHAKVACQH